MRRPCICMLLCLQCTCAVADLHFMARFHSRASQQEDQCVPAPAVPCKPPNGTLPWCIVIHQMTNALAACMRSYERGLPNTTEVLLWDGAVIRPPFMDDPVRILARPAYRVPLLPRYTIAMHHCPPHS